MPALQQIALEMLASCRGRYGGPGTVGGVDEILQLLAGLEERNLFGGHFHLLPRFRVAAHAPAALPRPKAPKSANLDFLALLQRTNNALENGFDNGFRLLARQLGNPQNLFNEVGFRQCGLLGHCPVASLLCLQNETPRPWFFAT